MSSMVEILNPETQSVVVALSSNIASSIVALVQFTHALLINLDDKNLLLWMQEVKDHGTQALSLCREFDYSAKVFD